MPAGVVGPDEREAKEDGCKSRKEVKMISYKVYIYQYMRQLHAAL
jgi:hypothetical protein